VLEYTGLFTSGGQHRLRWRHQTYAEFLAALYLCERKMPLSQKLDLILHHGDPEKKVVPQLHEASAWLAGMDQDVFRLIMESEPEVLLRSDVARVDAKDRERLVETLLRLHDEEERQAPWFPFYLLRKLSHSALADQLRPYIADGSKWIVARELAIHIAHACETKDLQDALANVALDGSAQLELRCDAMHAVGEIGDNETKRKLKCLIADDPVDPDKHLKGYALQALWPTCLTVEELFSSLTSAKPGLSGSYDHFETELAGRLRATDLLPALAWLRERPHRNSESSPFNQFNDAIILMAWEHLDTSHAIELFGRVALSRIMSHQPIVAEGQSAWDELTGRSSSPPFSELAGDNDTKRRAVLRIMIALLSEYVSSEERRGQLWAFSFMNPFLLERDLSWFVEQFESAASEDEREVLAHLISWVFRWQDVNHVDALYAAVQRSAAIAQRFGQSLAAIPLDSEEALKLRARHARDLEMRESRDVDLPLLKPSPAERIVELLDEFEAGDYSAWWKLNYLMLFRPDGICDGSDYQPDLKSLPGWQSADEQTKARIRRASTEYLLHGQPDTDQWITTDEIHRPGLAGYKALYLIAYENSGSITTLPSAVWRVWAPVVLAFQTTGWQEESDIQLKLITSAYSHAPNEIIATLMVIIDRETRQFEMPHVIGKVEGL
jgi:predicted NACHT family NTPase